MCDVPSIAVFCSESVECFPGIQVSSKFVLKPFAVIDGGGGGGGGCGGGGSKLLLSD